MALPDLIEIIPPSSVGAVVTVPGSKSITNRALVLAALGEGWTTLRGALWSEDTRVMVDALRALGFEVEVEVDLLESANRTIRVAGLGGRIPRAGTDSAPLELHVGNAGTAARFLTAMLCLGGGCYRLSGVPRMHQRPQAELFRALRSLGYRIEAPGDTLPAVVHGTGPRPGRCSVSVRSSSQFASALILSAARGGWEVAIDAPTAGEPGDSEELPYVEMTRRMVETVPSRGGVFTVEPDASSGSYFWAAGHVLGSAVSVAHWPTSGWQADAAFPGFLPLPPVVSRSTDLADSIMTAIVLAPLGRGAVRFTDLGRLRLQECERVAALRTELTRCGARVEESGDTLVVHPGPLHGADIETYRDHRMAMCFAVLGLRIPGIRLKDPGCVRKTFPNFFAKLATPSPAGLGVRLVDPRTGRDLQDGDLLAGE